MQILELPNLLLSLPSLLQKLLGNANILILFFVNCKLLIFLSNVNCFYIVINVLIEKKHCWALSTELS